VASFAFLVVLLLATELKSAFAHHAAAPVASRASSGGDPHLTFNNGGTADFRGTACEYCHFCKRM
jgi:hypothetical protein